MRVGVRYVHGGRVIQVPYGYACGPCLLVHGMAPVFWHRPARQLHISHHARNLWTSRHASISSSIHPAIHLSRHSKKRPNERGRSWNLSLTG